MQQQQQQQQQQLPGRFLVPVTLWPCAKLARGVALVSSSVWAALVQPEQGAFLALYPLQPATAAGGLLLRSASASGSVCFGSGQSQQSSFSAAAHQTSTVVFISSVCLQASQRGSCRCTCAQTHSSSSC
jgi:hypothetical protein